MTLELQDRSASRWLTSLFTMPDMPPWSPAQYLRFADERTRPARDLLDRVPLTEVRRVVDLGCGPGNSTELLAACFPEAEVVGLDSSAEMLAAARERLPRATFVEADVASWVPAEPVDLLYANAVFQWVPDHRAVLARLFEALAPDGVMALQMPDNLGEPSHALMLAVSAESPWAPKFRAPIAREPIAPAAAYYDLLRPSASRIDIWRTVYHHPLANAAAIVDMVKSTGLRPYLARLDLDEQAEWLARYEARLAEAYPPLADGRVLFRFPRLFIVAERG